MIEKYKTVDYIIHHEYAVLFVNRGGGAKVSCWCNLLVTFLWLVDIFLQDHGEHNFSPEIPLLNTIM